MPSRRPTRTANPRRSKRTTRGKGSAPPTVAQDFLEAVGCAVLIASKDGAIQQCNQSAARVFGLRPAQLVGRDISQYLFDPARKNEGSAAFLSRNARSRKKPAALLTGRRHGGEEFLIEATVTRMGKAEQAVYVTAISDTTERRQDEERIRRQANFDTLTGLPNRNLFMDRLTQAVNTALRSSQRVAVMFIDLDGFKLVNDTFGHEAGDEVLRESGRRLSANVRSGDTVARLGGDEFTVVMPNLPTSEPALMVAQRMVASIEQPFRIGTQEALVSASIGIAIFPDDGREVHTLVRNADAAMYQAKESGKANYRFYTSDLNAQAAERMVIKAGLSKALKRHEFYLEYQPRRNLISGRFTGIEALLRWKSRDLGLVQPAKFLPLAEESGIITTIGEWVIGEACRQQRRWRDSGHHELRVAVNLSGRQLRQSNIVQLIAGLIQHEGGYPGGIELEITEAMIERDADHSAVTLKKFVSMGMGVTLDDFGAGSSSLGVLRRFPVDTIKVAQTLVHDIAIDSDSLEIVRAVVAMGHSLGRRVIAEGVETEQQERLLRELHCNEIQGYLVCPPLSADAIDGLLFDQHRSVSV